MAALKQYSQQDPQWSSNLLGFDPTTTIGTAGCLLTSMTMVASAYGFNETPATLNNKMKAVQGFQGALILPASIPQALPGMVYANYIQSNNQPAPMAEIDASLAQGQPVIVEVNFSPKEGIENHWIVLVSKQGNDYAIADPWPQPTDAKEVLLTARYGFGGTPSQVILAALWLTGPAGPVTPPAQPNLDTSVVASFKVYAAADGLAIRSQTLVSDATLLERLPLNSPLSVLEADATARAQIGQMNQWLPVKAADGTVGYAAAWYVSLTQQTPPPPVSAPTQPAQPAALVVVTTSDGVALRRAPMVSDATLIKYMPLGTQLQVVEDPSGAQSKIGALDQWIQVKDITGAVGLVAGWCVAQSTNQAALGTVPQIPSTAAAPAANAAAPVLLRTTQDGLALRNAPVIADSSLIKQLPLGSELVATGAPAAVLPEIGQVGAWIQVSDVTGTQGYVAAWYVIQRPPDPPAGTAGS
ncbi:MAG: C39 family peptidase [Anaerolineales bacterium]